MNDIEQIAEGVVSKLEQDTDPAEGWISNGRELREDFEVDPRLSCTNTDFGGDDPAKLEVEPQATFDPTEGGI